MSAEYFEVEILFFFRSVHYHYGEFRKAVANICRETELLRQWPDLAAAVREIDRQFRELRLSWYPDEHATILDAPNSPFALTMYQNKHGYINNKGVSVLPMSLLGTFEQKQMAVRYWRDILDTLYTDTGYYLDDQRNWSEIGNYRSVDDYLCFLGNLIKAGQCEESAFPYRIDGEDILPWDPFPCSVMNLFELEFHPIDTKVLLQSKYDNRLCLQQHSMLVY